MPGWNWPIYNIWKINQFLLGSLINQIACHAALLCSICLHWWNVTLKATRGYEREPFVVPSHEVGLGKIISALSPQILLAPFYFNLVKSAIAGAEYAAFSSNWDLCNLSVKFSCFQLECGHDTNEWSNERHGCSIQYYRPKFLRLP